MHLNKTYDGPLEVKENATLGGMVDGDLTVAENVSLQVSGMITGNPIVMPKASVYNLGSGIVSGKVINRGGTVSGF